MTIDPTLNYTSDGKAVESLTRVGPYWVGLIGRAIRMWDDIGQQLTYNGEVMGNAQNYLRREGDA